MSSGITRFEVMAFFPMVITVIVFFFIARYIKLAEAESYFQENKAMVKKREAERWLGPLGRTLRHSEVGHILMFPKRSIRKGRVTRKELDTMPKMLKFWMLAPLYLGYLFMAWMVMIVQGWR